MLGCLLSLAQWCFNYVVEKWSLQFDELLAQINVRKVAEVSLVQIFMSLFYAILFSDHCLILLFLLCIRLSLSYVYIVSVIPYTQINCGSEATHIQA